MGIPDGFTVIVIVGIANIVIGNKDPFSMTCVNGIEQNSRKTDQEHFLVHLYKVSSHVWNVLIDSINCILRPKTEFRLLELPN